MGYFEYGEYRVVPTTLYSVLRGCSGCGGKRVFECSGKFRVNANGKRLDIWLVYQCASCKHTYNLSIYSRVSRDQLDPEEYEALLRNDARTAARYGLDRTVLLRNGAVIAGQPDYVIQKLQGAGQKNLIRFCNPAMLQVRADRLLAQCFGASRSKVKHLLDTGALSILKHTPDEIIIHVSSI